MEAGGDEARGPRGRNDSPSSPGELLPLRRERVQHDLRLRGGFHPPYAERWKPSDEEKLARFASMLVNAGTFEIQGDRLLARPLFAVAPEFVGGEGRFRFGFVGDTLDLTWEESIASDGLPYPAGGVVTLLRLVRIP